MTGNPVIGSSMIFPSYCAFFCGVSTMRPDSILASSGSPARIPSFRRRGPGRTICPLGDTRVCIVRRSTSALSFRKSLNSILWAGGPGLASGTLGQPEFASNKLGKAHNGVADRKRGTERGIGKENKRCCRRAKCTLKTHENALFYAAKSTINQRFKRENLTQVGYPPF
jgi:hypothetical protein